jgi:2-phospho-L-lactate/phosphoenolpyruvate guanylyltransferase
MGLGARANGTLPPVAVIPLKGLDHAKSRLRGVLSHAERADLALRMLAGVVGACQEAGLAVCVVSPDPQARAEAVRLGAETLDDGGLDLSGAVSLGLARYADAEAVVAIAADLPFVTAADVRDLLALADPLVVAAAPDGTTNAAAACPPSALRPSYGPGSAARHGGLQVRMPRLEKDIDTPADLASWRSSLCA